MNFGLAGDLNKGCVPTSFSQLHLEKDRDRGNSEKHKNAFQHFATRTAPAVNAGLTKFDRRK
jgi:hypothetical protein